MVRDIPEKPFYKIGDVCQYTDTQPYVLRFWESEFPQLAPEKNRSGQRVYTREDIDLVLRIKKLLYDEEYTIAGARKRLEQESAGELAAGGDPEPEQDAPERAERWRGESPWLDLLPSEPSAAQEGRRPGDAGSPDSVQARTASLEERNAGLETRLEEALESNRRLRERAERVASRLEALLSALETENTSDSEEPPAPELDGQPGIP